MLNQSLMDDVLLCIGTDAMDEDDDESLKSPSSAPDLQSDDFSSINDVSSQF